MSAIGIELLLIFVLTIVNGVFSMSEAAMISARKARLQQAADQGSAGAQKALKISNSPNNFLSTVQIGITLIGILQGAVAGNTIAAAIADLVNNTPLLAPYAETISVGIVVLGVTFLSLVLGELVPKNIALNNPERIASTVAGPRSES